jgi:hypothetical protein
MLRFRLRSRKFMGDVAFTDTVAHMAVAGLAGRLLGAIAGKCSTLANAKHPEDLAPPGDSLETWLAVFRRALKSEF